MKLKLNFKNIRNYIQGNARYLGTEVNLTPTHIIEQVAYRASKCPECMKAGVCQKCGCSVPGRLFVTESCDLDKYPQLLSATQWKLFKEYYNLKIDESN